MSANEVLLDDLERVRTGANSHLVTTIGATYRSFVQYLEYLQMTDRDPHKISQVQQDIQAVEHRICVYIARQRHDHARTTQADPTTGTSARHCLPGSPRPAIRGYSDRLACLTRLCQGASRPPSKIMGGV